MNKVKEEIGLDVEITDDLGRTNISPMIRKKEKFASKCITSLQNQNILILILQKSPA